MGRKKGFTLVELLVVISIIALLMSVLMPALSKVKVQAKKVVCLSNVRQLGVVASMYTMDNGGFFPDPTVYKNIDGTTTCTGLWMHAFRKYYQDQGDIRLCPAAKKAATEQTSYAFGRKFLAWGVIPEGYYWGDTEDYGSYGLNSWLNNPKQGVDVVQGHDTGKNWRSVDVRGANNIPMFADAIWPAGSPEPYNVPMEVEDFFWTSGNIEGMNRFLINRHGGGTINAVFLDGSARDVGLKELWVLKWHRSFDCSYLPSWPSWMDKFKNYNPNKKPSRR